MFCKVLSADICGIEALLTCVELDVSAGLPSFNMVGLPSSEVREARERVERALINSGADFPARRITVNLSPANIRKQGSGFDLPMAVGILTATGVIKEEVLKDKIFLGELSLDGTVNKVKGVLPVAILAKKHGIKHLIVPKDNAFEGSVVDGIKIHGASSLKELIEDLKSGHLKDVEHVDLDTTIERAYSEEALDYIDVIGQEKAKRATMIAVAGFHNLMYIGSPGSGKSMMARRIPTIFNRLTKEECLEVSAIYSVAGLLKDSGLILTRPFRSPHQSISSPALIGGGSDPRPGEVTLAHKGVLFLDEMAEFKKNTIDDLRVPIEEREVIINRTLRRAVFPCDFMLVAASNPCKCGFYPDRRFCRCSEADAQKYLSRIQGPVLDRIDICVGISRVEIHSLSGHEKGMSSADMRELILRAQKMQLERFRGTDIFFNSRMSGKEIEKYCESDKEGRDYLKQAFDKMNMTARGYYKTLKVARTIADIEGAGKVSGKHVLEALGYRNTIK